MTAGRGVVLAAAFVAVGLWSPLLGYLDRQGEHGPLQFAAIERASGWSAVDPAVLPPWTPSYAGMRGEHRAAWQQADRPVGLYIAYYRDQKPGEELISSENRVLISKDPVWKRTASGARAVRLGAEPQQWNALEMVSSHGRMMVWNVYWVGGRWTTSDHLAKVYLALSRLAGDGDDSAAVMVYTPYGEDDHDAAEATLARFLAEMGDGLDALLAQTAAR
jgi:EpsI family protein